MDIITFIKQLFGKSSEVVKPVNPNPTADVNLDNPLVDDCPRKENTVKPNISGELRGLSGDSQGPIIPEIINIDGIQGSKNRCGEEQITKKSLLHNKEYIKLAEQNCELVKWLEEQLQTEPSKDIIKRYEYINNRIRRGLLLSGASPITEETTYSRLRHEPIDDSDLKNGTPITIVEDGLAIEERVMILAKVKPLNQ